MDLHRLKAFAAAAFLAAAASAYSDTGNPEPADPAECAGSTESAECPEAVRLPAPTGRRSSARAAKRSAR